MECCYNKRDNQKQIQINKIKQISQKLIFELRQLHLTNSQLIYFLSQYPMKLDFSALANNINNESSNDILNSFKRQLHQSNQLGNPTSPKQTKLRKSQLNDQNDFVIKTSIISSYFNNQEQNKSFSQQKQQKVNLSVLYPYQISKELNQSNMNEQINDMKKQGFLNESALKFIKKQILKDFSKSKSKQKSKTKQINNTERISQQNKYKFIRQDKNKLRFQQKNNNQSIFIQFNSRRNSNQEYNSKNTYLNEQKNSKMNFSQESAQNEESEDYPLNTLLFKQFVKQSLQKDDKRLIKSARNNIKNNQNQNYLKINAKQYKNNKTQTQPNYMSPIHNMQKINRTHNQMILTTDSIKLQQQLKQLKQKPSLELTQNSPFTQKVVSARKNNPKTNIFNSLHNQAYFRQCKKSLEKKQIEKQIQQSLNKKKTLETNQAKKYKIQASFYERLQRSIQKKYNKDQLKKKYSVNPSTGYPLFKPDTTRSQHTYQALFHKSLEKQKQSKQKQKQIYINDKNSIKPKENQKLFSKRSNKRSSQQASTTYYSSKRQNSYIDQKSFKDKQKSYKQTKQNSLEKIQYQNDDTYIFNKTVDLKGSKYTDGKSIDSDYKSSVIVEERNQKLVEKLVNIFYKQQNNSNSNNNEISIIQEEDFKKSYEAISCLTQQEYHILEPLFQQIQHLQKSSPISILMFKNIFLQFFKKLNLYDQLILRQPLQLQRKKNKTIGLNHAKQFIDSLAKSRKKQIQKNNQNYTYRPTINYISASMQKINQKYEDQLYYV